MYDEYILKVSGQDLWDEKNERFIIMPPQVLILKHTLLSLSEWEGKWKIPFLDKRKKTFEQYVDYIKCMTQNIDVLDPNVWSAITPAHLKEVQDYLNDTKTATTFVQKKQTPGGGKFITAELIYFWMSTYNIPYTPCEQWNLNRLLTLIKVANEENKGPQKQSRAETMASNRALNEARKKAWGTRG